MNLPLLGWQFSEFKISGHLDILWQYNLYQPGVIIPTDCSNQFGCFSEGILKIWLTFNSTLWIKITFYNMGVLHPFAKFKIHWAPSRKGTLGFSRLPSEKLQHSPFLEFSRLPPARNRPYQSSITWARSLKQISVWCVCSELGTLFLPICYEPKSCFKTQNYFSNEVIL